MKRFSSAAVMVATTLSMSGCTIFFADGSCGSITGEVHPRFILEEQIDIAEFSPTIDFPFLFEANLGYREAPVYHFSSDEVTNAFAVRPFQVPGQLDAEVTSSESGFFPIYLTVGPDELEVGIDTRPEVEPVDITGEGSEARISSASVDYGALGGFLPTVGYFMEFDAGEAPLPFILPVDVFTLCDETPEDGANFLYGPSGILNADSVQGEVGELTGTSSLRTYPGFAGDEFNWVANDSSGYAFEVEPTVIPEGEFELQAVNIGIVPWFEAMGEPSGNAAEDSSRASYIWLSLIDEFGRGTFADDLFLSNLAYSEAVRPVSLSQYPSDPASWNAFLDGFNWQNQDLFGSESLGPVTHVFAQVMAVETLVNDEIDALSFKYDFFDITQLQPVPYLGPVVTNDPETAQSGSTVTYTGSDLDEVTSATIAGQSAAIVSKTASSLTLRVPAGLTQGMHDVILHYSTTESLTLQNGLVVQDLMKVWTQLQSDNTVKMYAKNIIGEGKIQFFHNSNEIAWVRASNALNPKLRQANGSSYLVRTRELVGGKNAFEIYQDGKRIWRAAYAG